MAVVKHHLHSRGSLCALGLVLGLWGAVARAADLPAQSLDESAFAQALVQRNLELQYAKRSVDVAEALARGESGVYEPVVFGTIRHTDTERQRTAEEVAANIFASSENKLDEESRLLELGVKGRTGWGGDLSMSAQRAERKSNILLDSGTELEVNTGLAMSYRQPLGRGRGATAVETDWRVAQLEAQATRWQYRQQLQKIVAEGLSLFWQVETADRIVAARKRLVTLADWLVGAGRERVQAGKLAPLAIGELERDRAARRSERLRAEQTRDELRLRALSNLNANSDQLERLQLSAQYGQAQAPALVSLDQALAHWAPYRVAQLRETQGRLRLAYAENQAMPAADLVVTHRQTGLADSKGAWELAKGNHFPEWSVGLTVELGAWGERRAAAQQVAQQERVRQSTTEMEAIRVSFRNDWFTRQQAWSRAQQEIKLLSEDVQGRWDAWQAERQRHAQGLSAQSVVWMAEQDWWDSQVRLLDAQGRAEAARLSLMLAQGELLAHYGVDDGLNQGD